MLEGRHIRRIDPVLGGKIPSRFQCLHEGCGKIYSTTPQFAVKAKSCYDCRDGWTPLLTNEIIDQRLEGRNIKRIGNYVRSDSPLEFKCTIENCKHLWRASPNSVSGKDGNGCPKCAGTIKLTNEDVDKRLIERNIRRIGDYIGQKAPIEFKCTIIGCECVWPSAPGNILNGSGCPNCAGLLKLINETIDLRLEGKNIERVDDYPSNNKTSILYRCLVEGCYHEWLASTSSIINNNTGCPNCIIGKNEKRVGQLLSAHEISYEGQKILKSFAASESNRIRVDFYLPITNTIIEYNGRQHYMPVCFGGISRARAEANFVKQQSRDLYLQQFCDRNNITLIWIDGRKHRERKLERYMFDVIIPMIRPKLAS